MGGSESCIQTINVIDVVGRNDITSVFFVRSMKSVRQSGTEKHPPLLLTKRMEKERKKERKKEGRKEGMGRCQLGNRLLGNVVTTFN